ncbi:MAG: hypothetical protein OHK0022_25700 [Roseiflexaceae bacterium]
MNIALATIYVDDLDRAYTFYTQVLGLLPRKYFPEASVAIVGSPEQPEGAGLVLQRNEQPVHRAFQQGMFESGQGAVALGTADIQREYERLLAQGVVFRQEPILIEDGMLAIFEDTCGNLIYLFQRA